MDNAILHRGRLVVFTLALALALAVVVMWPPRPPRQNPPYASMGAPWTKGTATSQYSARRLAM
jgi:hypothetical protein